MNDYKDAIHEFMKQKWSYYFDQTKFLHLNIAKLFIRFQYIIYEQSYESDLLIV
jgi:hypothetical protein